MEKNYLDIVYQVAELFDITVDESATTMEDGSVRFTIWNIEGEGKEGK